MEKNVRFFSDRFVLSCFGFIVGIFVASLLGYSFVYLVFGVSLVAVIFLYVKKEIGDFLSRDRVIVFLLFILCILLGIARFGIKDMHRIDERLVSLVGDRASLQGVIVEEPVIRESYVEYQVKVVDFGGEKILVRGESFPLFSYGDQVSFEGILKTPEVFDQGNGKVFDYQKYLAKDDMYLTLSFAQGTLISSGHGNFLKRFVLFLKNNFKERMVQFIQEPESNLARGLLLGDAHSLGKKWEEVFRQVGLSHIVVLSGYNITLVAQFVSKALYFTPRAVSLWGSITGVVLFSIMVGGGPSVTRAALLAILILVARISGRSFHVGRAFLFVGTVMLLNNPKLLVFDLGFQLSFIATAALIWGTPLVEKKLIWCRETFGLRSILASTLATQLAVAPLLLYSTGTISLSGLLVNVLVLPIIPSVMLLCFSSGILGFIPAISFPIAFISQIALSYVFFVAHIFSKIPFSTMSFTSFSLLFMMLAYVAIGFWFFRLQQKKSTP